MELVVIRHALPVRISTPDGSPADPPLSEVGRLQAERLAAWLARERLDAIYASPMRRARETAAPLAAARGLAVGLDAGLVELDHRADAYVPMEELKAESREAWLALVKGGLYANIDVVAFRRGVVATFESIIRAHPGGCVAVVCHSGVINAFAAHVLGIETPIFFDPDYTSVQRFLAASSGERMVASLNERAHLRE
ncbi:MAG TPA: histidine phosphatase family protein [Myxococcota bacterium]|nr:histidine phosphatase family protein [Myxococcota bacterium]